MNVLAAQPLKHDDAPTRVRVRVRGSVQGVGFRPFVWELAGRFGLSGWVLNDGEGVLLEVEGSDLPDFLNILGRDAPPLARIDSIEYEGVPLSGNPNGFHILESKAGGVHTSIPADTGVCDACLEDLFNPNGRHYLYPFVTCTHCGPRYTITRALPYDRPMTSMVGFAMCPDCASEYENPADRRFHAQPIACGTCGPELSMPVAEIVNRLRAGEIVAIKGLGGFHLACDARNEDAVQRLRDRKDREEKPFAVMTANLASLDAMVTVNDAEADLLQSAARPIVLLDRNQDDGLAPSVAPGLGVLGVMLPYTPLHYLLFHEMAGRPDGTAWLNDTQDLALVMTSANPGGEPLVTDNAEAHRRLAAIADVIVTHDRDIQVRADDSVMRVSKGVPRFIRRARGFVPVPVKLPHAVTSGLAVGGYLKSTVCVTRGDEAFVSQHIGDLDTVEGIRFFEETVEHLLSITDVKPEWVAHDRHPDFHSTRFAKVFAEDNGVPAVSVQHHHAHVAAVAAERGLVGPVLGLALDGFGLGEGAHTYWGGEALWLEGDGFDRLGHIASISLPGGEATARAPWKISAGILHNLGRGGEIAERFAGQGDGALLQQILDRNINVVSATSMGRLFDGAAGLLGVKPTASFEGQAPMLLEGMVTTPEVLSDGWRIADGVLDFAPLLAALVDMDAETGANVFHGTLIMGLTDWVAGMAEDRNVKQVVLAGGCLMNRVLAEGLDSALNRRGIEALQAAAVPPNDGGISLGQAWIAQKIMKREA